MYEIEQPINSPPASPGTRLTGARRAVATALLTVGLFAVGGTAVALAADPSASPAPANPSQPSGGSGGSGAPSTRPNHANGQGCPNMGGSGGSGGSQAPATPGSDASPSV